MNWDLECLFCDWGETALLPLLRHMQEVHGLTEDQLLRSTHETVAHPDGHVTVWWETHGIGRWPHAEGYEE